MASALAAADPRGARFNEAVAAGLLLVAFVINQPLVVPAVATVLLASALFGPGLAPFLALYARVIGPRLEPPAELEDPRPMRFADAFAALLLAVSTATFVGGNIDVAWSLALFTAVVTALSATTSICVGCAVYHVARRRGGVGRLDNNGPHSSYPVLPRGDVPTPAGPAARPWRARWIGLRTLRRWVKVVDRTSDGALIVRAGSDRLVFPQGGKTFWPVAICRSCQKEITSLDVSRRQRRPLCDDCSAWSQ